MKAIVHQNYKLPKGLVFTDVDTPIPKENEVRVKIIAASLNATDFEIARGDTIIRLVRGIRRPKDWRVGCDLSGVVDMTGDEVTKFKKGDEIYVDVMYQKPSYGALAEYICISEDRLRIKPKELSFHDAATIPQAGTLAVQAIREHIDLDETKEVLINGAGGGVGTFALQLAKYFGATVTAVDRSDKFEMLQSLGADVVIDYREQDFTRIGKKFDLIIDVIATRGVFAHRRALKENGVYRMVGGSLTRIIQNGVFGAFVSKFSDKTVGLLFGRPNDKADMEFLSQLILEGSIKVVIDNTYRLEEVPMAIHSLELGDVKGKIVIDVSVNKINS